MSTNNNNSLHKYSTVPTYLLTHTLSNFMKQESSIPTTLSTLSL